MKNFLKKILPNWLKQLILEGIKIPALIVLPLFKLNRILASLWYFLFSRKFDREHKAVLDGKYAYYKSLSQIGQSSALLRRNIHRLEKGLIMQPRRDVFAEDFIEKTVKVYARAVKEGSLNEDEKKWFTDVLTEYFSIVKDSKVIVKARNQFQEFIVESSKDKKFIPYSFDSLPEADVNYEQLHKLFTRRRSIRWYQDRSVPIKEVEKAISLATLAPSACNRQPYMFYVSESKDKALQMAKCAVGTPGWVENIPCIIAIVGDLSAYPEERDRHLIYIDGSLAAMQLMLAFEAQGLATCPINWPDIEKLEKKMQLLLELKSYERPIMLLSVGYPLDKGGIPYSQKKSADILIKKV